MQAISKNPSGNWIEQHPLLFALVISLAVHAVLFALGATVLGVALLRDPELLKQIAQSPERVIELTAKSLDVDRAILTPPPPPAKEMPMLFIEVDPNQKPVDEPENVKFYAAQNSLAANPDTKLDTDQPKIDGRQTKMIRAFEAPKAQPKPLQPQSTPQAKVEADPFKNNTPIADKTVKSQQMAKQESGEGKQERGDLEQLHPSQSQKTTSQQTAEAPSQQRPKTLNEAKLKSNDYRPPGEKMQQEGGVKRFAVNSSLQAKATPLGRYDAIVIDAIRNAWYAAIDNNPTIARKGHVVVRFRMHSNGRVSNLEIADTKVDAIMTAYCQIAIEKPSPFPAWPDEVKRELASTYRDVVFTFNYQ
ncbi:MAG TPA: hypothetical protein VGH19_01540 [Verrucomicrobiae bacterium]